MRTGRAALSDPSRIATLHRLGLLGHAPEPVFEHLVSLASRFLGAPVSLITVVDDQNQYFKASIGLTGPAAETRQTPLSHSFCQHVVTSGRPLIVDDARVHPVVRDNLAVRDLSVIAYLGVPIRSPDDFVLGSFCVVDIHPREWKPAEIDLLEDLAELAMGEIAARHNRIEADAALRACNAKMQAVFECACVGIASIDASGTFTMWNPAMEKVLGWRATDIVGRATPSLLIANHEAARLAGLLSPGTKEAPPDAKALILSALALRRHVILETSCHRGDETSITVLLHLDAILGQDGSVLGGVLAIQDLSAPDEMEAGKVHSRDQATDVRDPGSERAGSAGMPAHVPDRSVLDERILNECRALPGRSGRSMLADIVDLYLNSESERIAHLESHVAKCGFDEVRRMAHLLAGSCASLGAEEARAALLDLETAAGIGDRPGMLRTWTMAREQLGRVRKAVEVLREQDG